MYISANGDLIAAVAYAGGGAGGVKVPDALLAVPQERWRFDGATVVDAATFNTFYIDANGVKHIVAAAGWQQLACAYTDVVAQTNGVWAVVSALAQAQGAKITTLSAVCEAQITGGFTSSALGAAHTYPSGMPKDQMNLSGSVTASTLPSGQVAGWTTPFWCADANGIWAFTDHTAAQIQQVGEDFKSVVVAAQQKLIALTSQVNAAASLEAVNSVDW
jgi:hypothetical protein